MPEKFSTHVTGYPSAPFWLTVIIPLLVYPIMVIASFTLPEFYNFWQRKEGGIEFATVIILLFGVPHGLLLLFRYRDRLPRKWLVVWFSIATFGMTVFAGEELSWGQHLGFWTSEQLPDALRAINDQDESNFHNISNVFDQGITNLVVGGVFAAYFLLPLYQRMRRETMQIDNPGYWFWPTRAGLIAAIGVMIIPFPKRICEWTTGEEGPSILRHSEFHEFYIALLMTTYMVDVFHRARAAPKAK